MVPGKNRARQVIEAGPTRGAAVPLAMALSVIVAIPSHRRTVTMGTVHAIRPAILADQLVTLGIVDQ